MKRSRIIAALTALLMLPAVSLNAHADEHPFTYNKDAWAFANTFYMIGNFYRLTPDDHAIMEKTLSHTERRVFEECMAQKWQGCCYGFAVTALMAHEGMIDLQKYTPDAACLHDIDVSEEAVSLLDYYQQMQCMDETRNEIAWITYYETSEERLQKLLKLVKDASDENDMAEKDNYSEFIARKEDLHELNQLLDQEFARPEKERNYDRIERFYVSMQTLRALIK